MGLPLVSVVIPAYHAERFVGAAISSALTQTYPNLEVVVTNDGSTDRTAEVLAGYGDLVRVVDQSNGGVSSARNAAIAVAHGDLICVLDADDILLPAHVETAVRIWEQHGGGRAFVTSDAMLMTSAGIMPNRTVLPGGTPGPDRQRLQIIEANFVSNFTLFPREMWVELGGFDEQMPVCEDYDFWARAIFSGYVVHFSTTPTGLYRRSGGSLSTQHERMYAGDHLVMEHLQAFEPTMSAEERAHLRRRLASPPPHREIHAGECALRVGDGRRAAAHFREASALLPSDRKIRRKATLLTWVPAIASLYARRLAVTDRETGSTPSSPPS